MKKFALVMTSNPLYKNAFINELVQRKKENIGLIVELNFRHKKTSPVDHLKTYLRLLGFRGGVATAAVAALHHTRRILASVFPSRYGYGLKQIAAKNGISYCRVTSVNTPAFEQLLEEHGIDYIINSGNQIYGKRILKKWNNRILNRHTSLLPAYGGIYPVFWQMLNSDSKGGVTLHWVDEKIDQGSIAYQQEFPMDNKQSLFGYYKTAFDISLELCCQAISDLDSGQLKSRALVGEPSYYSWPTIDDIRKFKQKKLRIV